MTKVLGLSPSSYEIIYHRPVTDKANNDKGIYSIPDTKANFKGLLAKLLDPFKKAIDALEDYD